MNCFSALVWGQGYSLKEFPYPGFDIFNIKYRLVDHCQAANLLLMAEPNSLLRKYFATTKKRHRRIFIDMLFVQTGLKVSKYHLDI
jgi:hypothetical protein